MSDSQIECPSCGRQVPRGRFCKYCGKPLLKAVKAGKGSKDATQEAEVDHTALLEDDRTASGEAPEPIQPIPVFEVTIEGIDPQSLAVLLAKSELAVIGSELDRIIKLIEATRQALKLKEADKAILTKRADELRASFDSLKARRAELRTVEGKLPIEHIPSELTLYRNKLEKLDDMVGELDPLVYDEQRTRLLSRIKQLEKDHKAAVGTTRKWLKAIEVKKKDLKRDLSRLDAKYKIDDISEGSYVLSKAKVQRTIRVLELSHESLLEILKKVEKI